MDHPLIATVTRSIATCLFLRPIVSQSSQRCKLLQMGAPYVRMPSVVLNRGIFSLCAKGYNAAYGGPDERELHFGGPEPLSQPR